MIIINLYFTNSFTMNHLFKAMQHFAAEEVGVGSKMSSDFPKIRDNDRDIYTLKLLKTKL